VICAASIAVCATLSPVTPVGLIVVILYLHGGFRSLEFTCLTTLAFTEIPAARMSRANGFMSTVMQLSSGMGVAAGAITLRLVAHAAGHSAAVPQLRDFHLAILFMAFLVLGPVLDGLSLKHDAGADTSGHMQPEMEAAI